MPFSSAELRILFRLFNQSSGAMADIDKDLAAISAQAAVADKALASTEKSLLAAAAAQEKFAASSKIANLTNDLNLANAASYQLGQKFEQTFAGLTNDLNLAQAATAQLGTKFEGTFMGLQNDLAAAHNKTDLFVNDIIAAQTALKELEANKGLLQEGRDVAAGKALPSVSSAALSGENAAAQAEEVAAYDKELAAIDKEIAAQTKAGDAAVQKAVAASAAEDKIQASIVKTSEAFEAQAAVLQEREAAAVAAIAKTTEAFEAQSSKIHASEAAISADIDRVIAQEGELAAATAAASAAVDEAKASNTLDKVTGAAQAAAGSLVQVAGKAAMVGATLTTVVGAGALAIGISFDKMKESGQAAFTGLLGGAPQATKFLADLYEWTETKTPLGFKQAQNAAAEFAARGIPPGEIIKDLDTIANAAAAFPRPMEESMDRISYAMGQIRESAKLNSQDVRQLTEAGVNAWGYLTTATGHSIDDLQKNALKYGLTGKAAFDIIMKGMQDQFQGQLDLVTKTTAGQEDVAKRSVQKLAGIFADSTFGGGKGMLEDINKFLNDPSTEAAAAKWGAALKDNLSNIVTGVGEVTKAFDGIVSHQGTLVAAGLAIGAAFVWVNPLAAALAGTVLLLDKIGQSKKGDNLTWDQMPDWAKNDLKNRPQPGSGNQDDLSDEDLQGAPRGSMRAQLLADRKNGKSVFDTAESKDAFTKQIIDDIKSAGTAITYVGEAAKDSSPSITELQKQVKDLFSGPAGGGSGSRDVQELELQQAEDKLAQIVERSNAKEALFQLGRAAEDAAWAHKQASNALDDESRAVDSNIRSLDSEASAHERVTRMGDLQADMSARAAEHDLEKFAPSDKGVQDLRMANASADDAVQVANAKTDEKRAEVIAKNNRDMALRIAERQYSDAQKSFSDRKSDASYTSQQNKTGRQMDEQAYKDGIAVKKESFEAQKQAIADQKVHLDRSFELDNHNRDLEKRAIDDQIKKLDDQNTHIQNQIDLLKGQEDIWRRELELADPNLRSHAALKVQVDLLMASFAALNKQSVAAAKIDPHILAGGYGDGTPNQSLDYNTRPTTRDFGGPLVPGHMYKMQQNEIIYMNRPGYAVPESQQSQGNTTHIGNIYVTPPAGWNQSTWDASLEKL